MRTPVVTIVTQVRVDENRPCISEPIKPIGHFMTKEQAELAERKYGYVMKEDAGRATAVWLLLQSQLRSLKSERSELLVDSGQLVIACGGGGIPVTRQGNHLKGASAVIDKDFASELLAENLNADFLIILTAVEKSCY